VKALNYSEPAVSHIYSLTVMFLSVLGNLLDVYDSSSVSDTSSGSHDIFFDAKWADKVVYVSIASSFRE